MRNNRTSLFSVSSKQDFSIQKLCAIYIITPYSEPCSTYPVGVAIAIMLPSVSLYAIIVLSLSITVSFSTSEVTPKPCHGSHHCHRFGSTKNDVVRIWKLIGMSNTMYCISSEKIEFIFGWNNSTQVSTKLFLTHSFLDMHEVRCDPEL